MDLTFQVPMPYCSLQHRTLLLSPVPSTTGCCFYFGCIPSFLLELFLHWSPVAYWAPTDLGSSSFSVVSFCLFMLFMGFSRQDRHSKIGRAHVWTPVTSTTRCCFYFGCIPSFFLELFLHWSPVAYWAPTDLGSSSFSVLSFCLFILFMGFSRQENWSGLPFPSPVDHVLSELSSMTHPSWVALHGMAHSFIELDMAVVCVIRLVSFLWLLFSVCLPSDGQFW